MAGPGRATGGRPTLQTSSNQRDSNRLTRTPVTNVVNPSQKTTIISEKALGLTTFVTTGQKSTQKTPWIDDVCNNTHQSTPKSLHDKPDHIGGPENQAAVPVGGGEARPGFEMTHPATHQRPGAAGVKGAGGTGGHGRASRRGAERSEALASRAAGPSGARNTRGATSNNTRRGRRAGGPPPTSTPSSPAQKAHAAPATPAAPHSNAGDQAGDPALTLRRPAPGVPCS